MRRQTVMFTALPNGFAAPAANGGARLRLSVLISHRLMTNEGMPKPQLAQFPDLLDWPAAGIGFAVAMNGGPTMPAAVTSPLPSSDLWQALFKPTTYVRPYSFPAMDNRVVRSFPAAHVMGFLKQQYTKVAGERPVDYPQVESIGNRQSFGQIATYREPLRDPTHGQLPDMEKALEEQLNGVLAKSRAVPPSPAPSPLMDFYQVKRFHRSRNANPVYMDLPEMDFHQAVAALGDYPELLRRMGLVFDLEVSVPDAMPEQGTLRIVPSWAPTLATTALMTPWTHYEMDPVGIFRAASRPANPEIRDGMLDLSDAAEYVIAPADIDGAALKAIDFANNLIRSQSSRYKTADTPDKMSLPAMRSAGLSLMRTGRAIRLVRTLQEATQRNTQAEGGAEVELHAEDLTRGYRVDVWDDRSGGWHSLCRRRGMYRFTDENILVDHEDEGIVTMGVTQASDGSSPDVYLHESMLRWEGWSLSAPRPGRLIGTDDTAAEPETAAVTEFGLEVHFLPVPRSLPRLRFGTTYRMRARAVDLAGNSAPHDLADDSAATQPIRYGRFEPVNSPAVLLRAEPTEGESAERLVIRSNYDTPSLAGTDRHIAPPKAAQLLAETHGMFDAVDGVDKAAYDTIVPLETTYSPTGIHTELQLGMPYLPDPLGMGATFLGLPGGSILTQVPFADTGTWPAWLPFRLLVEEGAGAPHWDAPSRVLTVKLPKAEMIPVRISCYPEEAGLDQMGLWQWLQEAGLPPAHMSALRSVAARGVHWMLTPFRQLMLVHAVQQPLQIPQYQNLVAEKTLGGTFATLKDSVLVHGKSTLKLDVTADWDEPVDNLKEPAWRMLSCRAQAAEVQVQTAQTAVVLNHRHEFGDTRYRRVRYSGVATSRFKEYFHVRHTENMPLVGESGQALAHTEVVPQSEQVQNAGGTVTYVRDRDYRIDYSGGTLTRVAGGAIADGSAVQVAYAYLPGSVTRETEAPVEVDVLNSARPAAPKVLYVVPTFAWSTEEVPDGLAVNRLGGGLRVYMERPWFSSGDGELLGAVLWTAPKLRLPLAGATRPPEVLKPFVTQWGKDPIWLGGDTYTIPSASHFPRAAATATGLTLEEAPGTTFSVAGHKVGYDEERRLWYCDIEVDAGPAYFPFVRLALARYQPKSVPDAHLSRVVLADFAQLAPDRLATVIRDPSQPGFVAVTVCGPGYTMSGAGRGASDMEVVVEKRRADVDGDLGWIPASTQVFPLPLRENDGKSLTWAGGVHLPDIAADQPLRLMVREYERFVADGNQAGLTAAPGARIERRLVYAAVLEL